MADGSTHEFGPFRLDAEKLVLWRGDAIVDLTPKALALLRTLVEHGGDVVGKPELMSAVWPDTAVAEANLSVTVAALRKALDPQTDGRSYIQTVPRRGYRLDAPLRGQAPRDRLSLAVLPFKCLGPETEAHLGLGMADALIGRFTRLPGLIVRPTGAITQYVEAPRPPREAAQELGVDAVVDGTIQREGDRLRVSVLLVPRPAALKPWGDSFDADWTHLFEVQDTVAERVVAALQPRLGTAAPPSRRRAPLPEAHEAYLRGRYFWSRFDPESLGKAFAYFGEAARLDPAYAPPHRGLADAHLLLGLMGLAPPAEAWDRAAECAEQALSHDPELAEAYVSRAYARLFRDWDWQGARHSLERALALGAASSVHLWHGLVLALQNDLEGARHALARARETDPLSAVAILLQCFLHAIAGEYEQELELSRRMVELRPESFLGHCRLGLASVRLGHMRAGLEALRRAVTLSAQGPVVRALLAWALVQAGELEAARRELASLDAVTGTTFVSPCHRAVVRAALGDTEAALDRLEEGAEQRDAWAVFIAVDPLFEPLRKQARFEALRARVFGPRTRPPASPARTSERR